MANQVARKGEIYDKVSKKDVSDLEDIDFDELDEIPFDLFPEEG